VNLLPDFILVGAYGELKLDFVRDDIVLCPSVNRADSDDSVVNRFDLARDDRLERDNRAAGEENRVNRRMRGGSVPTAPPNRDVDGIDIGQYVSRTAGDLASLEGSINMQGKCIIGLREAREQTFFLSACSALLDRSPLQAGQRASTFRSIGREA